MHLAILIFILLWPFAVALPERANEIVISSRLLDPDCYFGVASLDIVQFRFDLCWPWKPLHFIHMPLSPFSYLLRLTGNSSEDWVIPSFLICYSSNSKSAINFDSILVDTNLNQLHFDPGSTSPFEFDYDSTVIIAAVNVNYYSACCLSDCGCCF